MISVVSFPLVAKSVRLNRLKLVLVASISSIVVINATFLIRSLNAMGTLIVPALVFGFTFIPFFVILLETLSHSNQSIAVFRSVGARKGMVTASILVTLVGAGLVGAVAGAALGLLIEGVYAQLSLSVGPSPLTDAVPIVQGTAYVLASFMAGLAAGVVAGVRFSWNKLS
jgi:ABC-type lipoprotein release transport system permease subunit